VTSPPSTDKKRFGGGFFFYFCQCGGFASNRGAGSIECMFFFPFLPLHNLFFQPCRSVERRHPHTTQSQARNLQTLRTQLRSWHWLQQRHRSQPLKKTLYLVGICATSISLYHRRQIHAETWGRASSKQRDPNWHPSIFK
jgi:hypothetical protein